MNRHLRLLLNVLTATAITVGVVAGVSAVVNGKRRADPQGDAYASVFAYSKAMERRNFGQACEYFAKATLAPGFKFRGRYYPANRVCAIGYVLNEGQSLVSLGRPIFDGLVIDPRPVQESTHMSPKNGYVFKMTRKPDVLYVSVQRDSEGVWRIVGIVQ